MKQFLILIFSLFSFSAFSQKPLTKQKNDSVTINQQYVTTLTKDEYSLVLSWIMSSGKYTGIQCQKFSDFLKANTKVIQDTASKK
jgi:hypothetical protein